VEPRYGSLFVAVAVALSGLVFAACGGSSEPRYHYPKSERQVILAGCSIGELGPRTACRCVLRELENNVPHSDYVTFQAAAAVGADRGHIPVSWQKFLRRCRK
jgi:hypothetical protein